MEELECMRMIDESIQAVSEEAAKTRIAEWVAAKYLARGPANMAKDDPLFHSPRAVAEDSRNKEIPGVAKLSQNGDIQLTVRDFKARSANDAAVRLVHVVVWATGKLTGETFTSSKAVVVPSLKKYRCYDGNTRTAIANDKGLVRDGDKLSLDFHAEQYAEKIIAEIRDPAVEGKWRPVSGKRRSPRFGREVVREVA